ncbi:hypothetical protein [Sphingomonas morindae]|uniref:Glycosyltransferase n=1 Tax=Sphingomonas morindae TaxID=1541170 RepID=A0ABY4XB76_9SPHN|nr:hypothetical protein [Sphingomonas morindae]USI74145.1 hypothetical protein LHA26_06735 [Sphingomonas morindae]
MIARLFRAVEARRHRWTARRVLAAPPIAARDDGVLLFSMIGTRVVLPYLVAVKSLHAALGRGRVVLLDDGSLTAADRALLDRQCGGAEIVPIAAVARGACPQGGCWERLLALLGRTGDHYVVQLDSDTVTLGPVPEVAAAIAANRSFTLLGDAGVERHGLLDLPGFLAAYHPQGGVDPRGPAHVQRAIESNWDRLPDWRDARYVRGCAGFAGFARGGFGAEAAERFSRAAEAVVGAASWARWGSEQVASNFLIANSADPVLLPYARYSNYWAEPVAPDARFLHFVGTHRYARGEYRRRTAAAIAALSCSPER